ncbi:PREDICTED: ubiquitin carboxyl-terminal hydrolase 47 isoform X1 [Polistes dominula]|uniref:Ubiquitin carboxyl-terminal hydrolase 47 n=2 Tax=Polistes dominula TaxID=743375 RepID=A0ABM1J290_POLDO|nr:PREDICTED: ubiquitin carboxyl-terminal hydrolase 47 isoform X1 [Polistes dominula]XP_015186576.1 PREDICTED: ubiquitin carboxyl-terminal hydrolase 47 isoform X1 [Polistes dominula]XP_015186577.1 PREDICTED: ubiquitin carboxyl-terminal hydrolase 47 isoform X1 [Polistes dominula]
MVHRTNEINKKCLIPYIIKESKDKQDISGKLELHESMQVKDLYSLIEEQHRLRPDSFTVHLNTGQRTMVSVSEMTNKTMLDLSSLDMGFESNSESNSESNETSNTLVVNVHNKVIKYLESEPSLCDPTPQHQLSSNWNENNINLKGPIKTETNYVGLVNQAMTCYLNSLLQALYMTPEFRNALYNWEYIEGSEKDETKSIPYQLQKLFLNLQTSTKSAVETTSLTKSFGWNSNEAWQQHDIQELCRVMFDALELKFRNTEQADLINRLYEGKMLDYVKCLECGTEKSREDTFLDIPLPVRPFGSNIAYNSVEEAMKAFVQHETLEGANQYHCEKCNKKCNAQKGLKFTKFPYLLTLHLKRFDYDNNSCHRIKLNDKVTFPDTLLLNSFIPSMSQESPSGEEDNGVGVKCDDSSTTDSGTLDDDCPPCDNNHTNYNSLNNHDPDDDEGIDMSNGPSTSNCNKHNYKNGKHQGNCIIESGPYIYELFSIMIHSGSASGGHYYAYIKDFRTREWWCFNDQSVTQITQDDIQKTYGGGSTRAYYSGAYSSSTNAYMLMYRQIDPIRNALPMQTQDFPRHIQELLKKMKESEDNDRRNREKQIACPKLKIYCHHPVTGNLCHTKLIVLPEYKLAEVTEKAYKKLDLREVVKLNQCRLVAYKHSSDLIECSYEGREQDEISSIWYNKSSIELLLEIRKEDEMFEVYQPGGITTKVFVIDIPKVDIIDGPINVRGLLNQSVKDYKQMLGNIINMDPKQMKLVLLVLRKPVKLVDIKLIDRDDIDLQTAEFIDGSNKVFVSTMLDVDSNKSFDETTMYKVISRLESFISLQVQIPDVNKEILEELDVVSLAEKYENRENRFTNGLAKLAIKNLENLNDTLCEMFRDVNKISVKNDDCSIPDLPSAEPEEWNISELSNSEDSSLSDSDKTLVGDTQEDDDFPPSYHPPISDNRRFDIANQLDIHNTDSDDESEYYFKATSCTNTNRKLLKVLVDKRMQLSTLKKNLEPHVGVPVEYFKVFRQCGDGESECTCLTDKLFAFDDGERLNIKLGRALRSGEYKIKLFQLCIDSITEPYKFLCETILSKDMTFGQAKKQILAELKKKHNIDIPYEKCRLRKKYHNIASKVFLDKQKFDQLLLTQYEMIVQELPEKETVTDNDNQVVLFVRRWFPAKVQLDQLQEVVLDEKSIDELKRKISSISNIPEKYIDIAKGKGTFPCDIHVLKVHTDLQWTTEQVIGNKNVYDDYEDGAVFLYRDSREELKKLSPDETKEITNKETARFIQLSSSTGYNRRSEKALKIYLDTK